MHELARKNSYGLVTPPLIGLAMKEAVRRAIGVIRQERFIFEAQHKIGSTGVMNDMVTSADKKAQKIYTDLLLGSFPTFGIVAEEEGLRIPSRNEGSELFFTVDPLDGTKAFARRQSHGIGTALALVCSGKVIAAYIGDVMSQEIYGYRPESSKVHRISEYTTGETLCVDERRILRTQHVLLRTFPHEDSFTYRLVNPHQKEPLFKDVELASGSIALSMARLWKGEVGAAILGAGTQYPWDICPIIGLSKQLGFIFIRLCPDGVIAEVSLPVMAESFVTTTDTLVVHASRRDELIEFITSLTR